MTVLLESTDKKMELYFLSAPIQGHEILDDMLALWEMLHLRVHVQSISITKIIKEN